MSAPILPPRQLGILGEPPGAVRALSQWHTDPALARRFVGWAFSHRSPGRGAVLEPSIGTGNLAAAALELGAQKVVGVELDADLVAYLRDHRFADEPRVGVHEADFLAWSPPAEAVGGNGRFGVAVANTPYENDADVQHILRALQLADAVSCICRAAILHVERAERIRPHVHATAWIPGRPHFVGDAKGADGPRSDFVCLHLRTLHRSAFQPVKAGWLP